MKIYRFHLLFNLGQRYDNKNVSKSIKNYFNGATMLLYCTTHVTNKFLLIFQDFFP